MGEGLAVSYMTRCWFMRIGVMPKPLLVIFMTGFEMLFFFFWMSVMPLIKASVPKMINCFVFRGMRGVVETGTLNYPLSMRGFCLSFRTCFLALKKVLMENVLLVKNKFSIPLSC